ncbi:16S rRNA (adenine(1518)-N(6)/adenine(1519)-N(6))-dimethyltransferase RsmA [Jongsikchunia kroppenstedtii]|uniref:16S rRNA (adenine(1518)-N(6)/adenine(1519)-N(6))- dimethyltransferase RsmA n=1 Tax=Jongsikchunia kroppenstedtii TaxID=1121721 RepID=UPI000367282C|nr:16S rRNA (adenine(1518)-N(6)/adenine(1519)-N(6))-dimethyltransferase RsmA [Jongsikchunia kroppenstedtii]
MAVLLVEAGSALNDDTDNKPRLLGPAEIRDLAEQLGVRPTKTLGQNFVHDANTVRKIVAAARVGADDVVLEVGPGLGSLTLPLLGAAREVIAVEIDPPLARQLPKTVAVQAPAQASALTVLNKDALAVSADEIPTPPTALVANLPYNVAVPVLLHLLAELPTITTTLVMVQKEVADRLAAGPGSKIYGVPSVKARYFGTVATAGTVGRNVFWPEPKVESALVRIDRHAQPPWSMDEQTRRAVFAVVDAAFAQRRKTLRAALAGWAGSADRAGRLLAEVGIDPQLRGERLDVDGYVRLAAAHAASAEPTRDNSGRGR